MSTYTRFCVSLVELHQFTAHWNRRPSRRSLELYGVPLKSSCDNDSEVLPHTCVPRVLSPASSHRSRDTLLREVSTGAARITIDAVHEINTITPDDGYTLPCTTVPYSIGHTRRVFQLTRGQRRADPFCAGWRPRERTEYPDARAIVAYSVYHTPRFFSSPGTSASPLPSRATPKRGATRETRRARFELSRLWGADHYLDEPPGSLDKTWWGRSGRRANSPPLRRCPHHRMVDRWSLHRTPFVL